MTMKVVRSWFWILLSFQELPSTCHAFTSLPTTVGTKKTSWTQRSEKVEKYDVLINGPPGINQTTGQPVNGYFYSTLPEINGYTMPSDQNSGYYSAFLEKSQPGWIKKLLGRRRAVDVEMDEDGYAAMQRTKRSMFRQAIRLPLKAAKKVIFPKKVKEPGTLILVRHGESEWNKNKTFTGWADPDLTEQGRREVEHAARLLMAGGYKIDMVFTSRLKRAIRSSFILLQELNEVYLPVFKSWRLNERNMVCTKRNARHRNVP